MVSNLYFKNNARRIDRSSMVGILRCFANISIVSALLLGVSAVCAAEAKNESLHVPASDADQQRAVRSASANEGTHSSHVRHAMYFAKVNGKEISLKEFQSAFKAGASKRFYHGKIPSEELQAFRQEVSQTLIDRVLLLEEASRQKIEPDQKAVGSKLSEYDKRYAGKSFWANNKASILPGLRAALEEQSVLTAFEDKVRGVALPVAGQALAFYKNNPALFTTPEKLRVSLILLKVAPSSPAAVWEAARVEAENLIAKIKNGMDFSQLARIHSGDATAAKGGDMGFIHKGMLAKPAQLAIDRMVAGEISQPIMLLRGVAVIRLEEKHEASLNEFEQVAERAKKLLQRESSKLAWADLKEKLRSDAEIIINTIALRIDPKV